MYLVGRTFLFNALIKVAAGSLFSGRFPLNILSELLFIAFLLLLWFVENIPPFKILEEFYRRLSSLLILLMSVRQDSQKQRQPPYREIISNFI